MGIWDRFWRWCGILKDPPPEQWWKEPKTVADEIAAEHVPPPEPKKLHFCPHDPMYPACGIHRLGPWSADPRETTCKNCKHTSVWKKALAEVSDD